MICGKCNERKFIPQPFVLEILKSLAMILPGKLFFKDVPEGKDKEEIVFCFCTKHFRICTNLIKTSRRFLHFPPMGGKQKRIASILTIEP